MDKTQEEAHHNQAVEDILELDKGMLEGGTPQVADMPPVRDKGMLGDAGMLGEGMAVERMLHIEAEPHMKGAVGTHLHHREGLPLEGKDRTASFLMEGRLHELEDSLHVDELAVPSELMNSASLSSLYSA